MELSCQFKSFAIVIKWKNISTVRAQLFYTKVTIDECTNASTGEHMQDKTQNTINRITIERSCETVATVYVYMPAMFVFCCYFIQLYFIEGRKLSFKAEDLSGLVNIFGKVNWNNANKIPEF